MQLDSITPAKSNQWLKGALIFLFIALAISSIFYFTQKQKGDDFYVDANYKGWIKWGSQKYPYISIGKAFQAAAAKKIGAPAVYVKNGEYREMVELLENGKIYGESRDGVILVGEHLLPIITMKNNSAVYNLTTVGGSAGILAQGQALIENCAVKEFRQKGIDAAASDSEIIIRNSEIFNGDNKGVYIQKGRRIEISGNKVHHNKGEGLDIRDHISGTISGNELYNNTESGIEFIVGGSSLDIKENNIYDNEASGITCQYYEEAPEKGNILIQANHIKAINAEEYTITVKSPSGGEGRIKNYWRDSVKILNNNVLEGEIKTRSLEISK